MDSSQKLVKDSQKVGKAIARVIQGIALKSLQKREKKEVEKAMLTSADKRKQAHDDFHKFVRSLQ